MKTWWNKDIEFYAGIVAQLIGVALGWMFVGPSLREIREWFARPSNRHVVIAFALVVLTLVVLCLWCDGYLSGPGTTHVAKFQ